MEHLSQRLVLVGLLMLKEPVQPMGLHDAFRLVREKHSVPVEGHAQLTLGHSHVPAGAEDGGRCDPCMETGKIVRPRLGNRRPDTRLSCLGGRERAISPSPCPTHLTWAQ